jgi:hypothetical protein
MARTKIDRTLEASAEAHADDPERAGLIQCARRFKASWIELAEALTHARRGAQWKRWGYESFDEYARIELHLKQETVDKLTGSFQFLQRRAPEVLRRDGVRESIPSYQAIDFLRRAEEQEGAPEDAVEAIRARVIDEGAPLAAVSRQFKDAVFPMDEGERKERELASLRGAAMRLHALVKETRAVPRKLASEVAAAVERLLDEMRSGEDRAA